MQQETQAEEKEHQPDHLDALRAAIVDVMSGLDPLVGRDFRIENLDRICRGVPSWSLENIAEQLEVYLLQVFPPPQIKPGGGR